MKNKSQKSLTGFTLIELLVVIAIIGILSSIIMVSLGAARQKAQDAKVKAQLKSAYDAAEIYFDTHGSYNGAAGDIASDCATADSMFQDEGFASLTDLTNYPPTTTMRCSSSDATFVMSASLSGGNFWCVDSAGNSTEITGATHADAHPDGATTCIP